MRIHTGRKPVARLRGGIKLTLDQNRSKGFNSERKCIDFINFDIQF